jgi:fatty acid desaturase
MFLQGVILVHHFSLQHECCHYTAFKTRKLNDIFGYICGFSIMLPNQHFRYEHCDHHTYTQLKGKDPELIELPISVHKYLWYISAFPYWKNKFSEIFRHLRGQFSEEELRFIPKQEKKTILREARIMVFLYILILSICIFYNFWTPLWYWWLPVMLGEPVMRAIRLTEHVGRPNTDDLKENTRSSLVSLPMQFLSWNMNYHAEHHYASSIPFHALPKLHKKLKGFIYVEKRGYFGAHVDIISQLIGKTPRSDRL